MLINNGPGQGKMEKWVQEGLGAGSWELGADASETSWALRALSQLDVFSCFTLLGQFGDNAAYACRVYCLRCLCRCQVPSV